MKKNLIRRLAGYSLLTLLSFVTVLLCSAGTPRKAWARAAGISNYSGTTPFSCTVHHSPNGTAPTVALAGPTSLAPGASGAYTFTIIGGAAVVGGLDVATSAGTLQASGAGTQLLINPVTQTNEVTHTAPALFSGNTLTFTFTLIAPSATGPLTLYAAGLSGNGSNTDGGDNSAKTTLAVNVAGSSANNPPSAPTLVSPANGQTGIGTTAALQWTRSTDPDNDPITYHLAYCTDSSLTSCTRADVAFRGTAGIYLAAAGLLLVGVVFTRGRRGKGRMATLVIVMLMTTGALFISCGGGGGGGGDGSGTDITHQVSGLNIATTYYWNVTADDGRGGLATSPTWSFTTQ